MNEKEQKEILYSKTTGLQKINFNFETITPLFLGGADGINAELRAPSIKGAMRFWWRAINGLKNIDQLIKIETKIFGGGGDEANKSAFSIRVSDNDILKPTKEKFPNHSIEVTSKGKTFKINILEYLAYGTYEYKKGIGNEFIRYYFPVKTNFELSILFRDENYVRDVLLSLYYLSSFGGLGSRSRNGFGGLNVLNRDIFNEIGKEYAVNILPTKEMLAPFVKTNVISDYSAFAKGVKLFKSRQYFDTWDKALSEIGKIYKEGRENLEAPHSYQKRQYIGAPLDPPRENFKSILERHSKPYFLQVIKEKEKQFKSYVLYLPSKYCEGLPKDRYGKTINHDAEDKKFNDVCNEFNEYLSSKLEVIL